MFGIFKYIYKLREERKELRKQIARLKAEMGVLDTMINVYKMEERCKYGK